MTFDEAKQLLSRVAVLDNRKVDATTVSLWQEILDPFTLAECMWALREFARNNTQEYLRPAHLIEIIRRKRNDYAWSNPGRQDTGGPEWLEFEAEIEQARANIKAVMGGGARYAVEAMEEGGES